jgi:hypothetical protein
MNELELEVARSGEREYISSLATGLPPGHPLVSGHVGPPNMPGSGPSITVDVGSERRPEHTRYQCKLCRARTRSKRQASILATGLWDFWASIELRWPALSIFIF